MPTVNRSVGDWYLKSLNGNIFIDANNGQGTTTINGNLYVVGHQTNVGSVETLITDSIITLSANVTGEPVLNAGIEVRRGNQPTVAIRWNEQLDVWESTVDGVTYKPFLSGLISDPSPGLGGNLSVNGYTIQSGNNQNIIFKPGDSAGIEIKYTNGAVPAKANAVVLYAKEPSNGQSGLYISNSVVLDEELITKRKALVYSLVL